MDLSDAYAIGTHIPNGDAYPPRWADLSTEYRNRLLGSGQARVGVAYGQGPRNVMDVFLPEGAPRGLVVFVHGGYWLRFDRSSWSYLAEGARQRGWVVAMPSYALCPQVRISDITCQISRAICALAAEYPGPIRLVGHSAGGHLVSRMGAAGVLPDDVADRVAHILPIAPIADLRPLMSTAMNVDLRLEEAEAHAESPLLSPRPAMPVSIWVGANERPALIDQAQKLQGVWDCGLTLEPGKHHFDVIDTLVDPESAMVGRLLSNR